MWSDPEVWRWVWGAATVVLVVAELITAGSFVALPVACGTLVGAVLAIAGVPLVVQVAAAATVAVAASFALRPLARHLDRTSPALPAGATRWAGRTAVVVEEIGTTPGAWGSVRLDQEVWRAESPLGTTIPVGATVLVTRVDGVRLVVLPTE